MRHKTFAIIFSCEFSDIKIRLAQIQQCERIFAEQYV